ncbi:Katanin p60 ATPase-containing subunit A1 [Apostasia shenzhenica]|uniref:Katanin p60 ATPase-containing subunit A1 n=1 Tax=Apostasia shenzhenica TaxID=1088818 RepID=A0A2I0AQB3_9ASPA|nr:Katanin p60 ATPase-containing subunit A1 [Apostasia shenzhenica]
MEERAENWRAEVEENLRRLHSLLFGVDAADERGDPATAQVLGLRLLGFLDSHTVSSLDHTYISPIRAEVQSRVASATRALASNSDRQAFEQARRDVGRVFVKCGDLNIEKVKNSLHFQDFLQMPKGNAEIQKEEHKHLKGQVDKQHEKLSIRPSKLSSQTKITSIYSSTATKPNKMGQKKQMLDGCTFEEYVDIENEHISGSSVVRSSDDCILTVEENEKPNAVTLKTKRRHTEFTSPICANVKSPSSCEEASAKITSSGFVTARMKLETDNKLRYGGGGSSNADVSLQSENYLTTTTRNYGVRSGGISRRGFRGNFVPPIKSNGGNTGNMIGSRITGKCDDSLDDSTRRCLEILCGPDGELPEKLRNLEPRLIEHVSNEIMDKDPNVRWNDIAGLEHAKKCVTEMVIWPLLRPDIFCGCRSPGRGLLLFGPPGTGKTMIGKAIAGEAKATFFYISASSLTSKWIGEGEKLVRALFGVASCRQPAVIFVDEIDSLLSQRKSDGEHESSRRLKTQFLIEMEGFDSGNEQILIIGATNRPQELDEAARRRLTKRLYIPLPSSDARAWIIRNLLEKDGLFKLSNDDTTTICKLTEGYSGSDMKNLVKDASMGPLREALKQGIEITNLRKEDMRPVTLVDFESALSEVRPSVSLDELGIYEEWNKQFGSLSM